jgi:hypothetical protein
MELGFVSLRRKGNSLRRGSATSKEDRMGKEKTARRRRMTKRE